MPPLSRTFHLQGHRGARGRKPENTLPAFEAALDAGVSSVETDLHLTRDGAVVLCHEPVLDAGRFTPPPADAPPTAMAGLTLAQLRSWRADRNPDPARFPDQDAQATPLARWYAQRHGLHPFAVPTLADLFRFAADYAGEPGAAADKTANQRARAARVGFDVELKRVPFRPDRTGDDFTGRAPGLLERRVAEAVKEAGVAGRTTVRAFDHRSVYWLRSLAPRLTGAILLAHTAPVAVGEVARRAGARIYCPSFDFVDEELVRQAHAAGVRVLPWTVNEPEDWERLVGWGVDGLTTDHPDRLAAWLAARGIAVGFAWEAETEGAAPI
jgi:glycerophosphoryl diester phosphodiesterase